MEDQTSQTTRYLTLIQNIDTPALFLYTFPPEERQFRYLIRDLSKQHNACLRRPQDF
jgi:hypothetical protein